MHSNNGRSANSLYPLAATALIVFSAFVLSACTTGTPANTWVSPNQNEQNTRYVGGRITTKTVDILGVGWTADIETKAGFGQSAPSPYITPRNVFLQTPSGRIKAVNLVTGDPAPGATIAANAVLRPTWLSRLKAGALRQIKSPISPILTTGDDDAPIVIGASGSKVVALSTADADAGWSRSIEAVGSTTPKVISNMAAAHGNVYVPVANVPKDLASLDGEQLSNKLQGKSSNNGQLVAISRDDGKVSWKKNLASVPLGAATVVNNIVFTSTLDGHVYGFDASSGDEVFESKLPAGAVSPMAAFDGTLIVPASFVSRKGQKAQVVAFTIGGLGEIGGAEAPKVKAQAEEKVAESAEGTQAEGGEAAATTDAAALFTANCAGCHVLTAANATGNVGPNLDNTKLDQAALVKQIQNGAGAMPAFKGTLTPEEIEELAKYVASAAGQ
ncbi:MAG: c-type cytochrome [Thermoleophilaceae bacterium]|nr:c-type cytochrome [Thermoleophilaceae bacterium]